MATTSTAETAIPAPPAPAVPVSTPHTPVLLYLVLVLIAGALLTLLIVGAPPSLANWAIGLGGIFAVVVVATAANQLIFARYLRKSAHKPEFRS